MAEGEQVSGRREDLMSNCSPCSTKGTDKTAVNYCFMCEASFCNDCTEQHSVFLSKHKVTEIESARVGVPTTFHTEMCPQHGRALRLYCKEDDSICCDECFDRDHLSCKKVVYLPSSAQEVIKNINVTEIKSELRRTIEKLGTIKIKQQETLTCFEADREKCEKEIDDHHAELLDLLGKIVQSSKDQVEQTFERLTADLQRHHQIVEKCLVDLKSCEKRLERNQGNAFPLFVELKKCQQQLKATEEVSTDTVKNLNVKGFSVAVDDRLHNLLSELESLVTVVNQAPVQVKKKYKIDVPGIVDNKVTIYGSCVLHDGSILLADYSNKMLKCVDQHSLKVKNLSPMQSEPNDVCVINNSEVAVTQDNQTVVIVSVTPRLTTTRTFSMKHPCEYIAYSRGELFINNRMKTLYIYNMEGFLLRKVSADLSGQTIFSRSRGIKISAAGDKVYIADADKGLIILDRQGQVQDGLVIDNIRGAYSLCLDGTAGLFVCGFDSNNVVHMSTDGQLQTEVLKSSDGLAQPLSVCYDRLRKRLIVTQHFSKQIHVCEWEQADSVTLRSHCADPSNRPDLAMVTIATWQKLERRPMDAIQTEKVAVETPRMQYRRGETCYWIGITDMNKQGVWTGLYDNVQVNFTAWGPGEPDGGTTEDCACLFKRFQYSWIDTSCTGLISPLCEYRPSIAVILLTRIVLSFKH